ncbi:hypothetical protein OIU74_009958 [Salix koriyanagi]|uniref:Myb/SANT-like domain-containing protein n=1 Tax=Salix koriyanagi TaxID=2511006 RepID=A0A9Q0QL55_9ROSI|nr:hypothetical protein OIU74_009958 [Salix koriyanagi]
MEGETGNQSKQERFRTRWTPSLDRIFADLVVQQIQLGNRPNNVFDKKTWNHIRDEFNKETGSKFNNNQLRKHLDVLRTRFNNVKSAFARNDFALVDPCGVGFDLWEDSFGAQPRPETAKVKDCPIYEQLCKIFTDTSADGKYAQSSHFEGLDKSAGDDSAGRISWPDGGNSHSEDPSSSKLSKGNPVSSEKAVKNAGERKRKRPGFSSGKVIDLVITTRKALGSCSCRFAILVPFVSSCGWWRALSTADARDALGKAFFSMAHPFAIHNMNLDLSNSGYWR